MNLLICVSVPYGTVYSTTFGVACYNLIYHSTAITIVIRTYGLYHIFHKGVDGC
jgi:hypothetical protein